MASFLSDVLSCPVCLDLYKSPKILLCGHSLCSQCCDALSKRAKQITQLMPGNREPTIQCPQCRAPTSITHELTTNFALQDAVTRYSFLEKQSQYRYCSVCQEQRTKKSFVYVIYKAFSKVMMISKTYRQKQATMEKLHQIHEALEDDIMESQVGNSKLVDVMHQVVHTLQTQAREKFDKVADRLETSSNVAGGDLLQFILADAELVRAQNKDTCLRVKNVQEHIANELLECLYHLKNGNLEFAKGLNPPIPPRPEWLANAAPSAPPLPAQDAKK